MKPIIRTSASVMSYNQTILVPIYIGRKRYIVRRLALRPRGLPAHSPINKETCSSSVRISGFVRKIISLPSRVRAVSISGWRKR